MSSQPIYTPRGQSLHCCVKDEQDRLGKWSFELSVKWRALLISEADVQHRVWQLLLKGDLYWAPIGQPKNVLDLVMAKSTCILLNELY